MTQLLRLRPLRLAAACALALPLGGAEVACFTGMCDASAGVALDARQFLVASDEDNVLRLYDVERPGGAVQTFNLTAFAPFRKVRDEMDLEGAARVGDKVFWITSLGRNKEGVARPNRRWFFATESGRHEPRWSLRLAGTPRRDLFDALLAEPRLQPFGLKAASKLPPKAPGGLNIEGLAATPDGHLLIAFRNPVPEGRALIVPLTNPHLVLEGRPPVFGEPVLLDLAGRGIRDLAGLGDRFLLIAGAADGGGRFHLHLWDPRTGAAPRVPAELPPHFHPEAIVLWPGRPGEAQLLSDDGTLETAGVPCKQLRNPGQRSFRSVWVRLPAP